MISDTFRITSKVTIGLSHVLTRTPCQDAAASSRRGSCTAIALSDGAGSRKYSHKGSVAASKEAALYVSSHFDELYDMPEKEASEKILFCVRKSIYDAAVGNSCEMRDLACTLLIAAKDENSGREIIFHIGDGLIFGCDRHGRASLISAYDHKLADNVTEFVTSSSPESCVLLRMEGEHAGFMLLSDGSEHIFKENEELATAFMTMSFILSDDRIDEEYREMFCGLADDSSIITLSDGSCVSSVFENCGENALCVMLGISKKALKKRKKTYIRFLHDVIKRPVTVNEAVRSMRQHSKKRTKEKLRPLLNNIIIYRDGRYTFGMHEQI